MLAHSARDVERFARDPSRIVRRQEHDGRGDVVGLTDPAERRLGFDLFAHFALGNARRVRSLGFDHARIDGIDAG